MLDGGSLHVVALWLMFAYCAAPGAVNAEAVRRGLSGGFESALLVQLGAVAGRVLWAGLALAGTGPLAGHGPLHVGLAALGGVLLLRASWTALVTSNAHGSDLVSACPVRHGDFRAGLLLSLTNPLALVFWSGIVSILGLDRDRIWDVETAPGVLSALAFGAFAWSMGAAAVIGWGRRAVGGATLRLAEVITGAALGFFGLRMLWATTSVLASMVGL
jgi:threonine/homoserine/homoserine lactone efflux protein